MRFFRPVGPITKQGTKSEINEVRPKSDRTKWTRWYEPKIYIFLPGLKGLKHDVWDYECTATGLNLELDVKKIHQKL